MITPNDIYDDRVKKITFNIPLYLWEELKLKTNKQTHYAGNKSSYLRELLARDMERYN